MRTKSLTLTRPPSSLEADVTAMNGASLFGRLRPFDLVLRTPLLRRHAAVKLLRLGSLRGRSRRCVLRLGRAVAVERVGRGVVHKVEDLLFVEEFHDRLGGVDVHVHHVRRQRDVQHAAGEFALHQAVCVGFLHRGGEELGLDEAAVDEKVCIPRVPRPRGAWSKAVNGELTVAPVDLDQRGGRNRAQRGVDGAEGFTVAGCAAPPCRP